MRLKAFEGAKWAFLLSGVFFVLFISRIGISPLLPSIEVHFGIRHVQAAGLFSWMSAGYILGLFLSGLLASFLSPRLMVFVSSMLSGAILLLVPLARGLGAITVLLFCFGLTNGLYLPSGLATLSAVIKPKDWGKAIAVHEFAPNLSFASAPMIVEVLLRYTGWKESLALLGLLCLLMGLLYLLLFPSRPIEASRPALSTFWDILNLEGTLRLIFLLGLGIGTSMGTYSVMPLYLQLEQGIPRTASNAMISLSRLPGILMASLSGWASDRLGPKRVMVASIICASCFTVLLGASSGKWTVVLLFAQAFTVSAFFPALFLMVFRLVPEGLRSLTVSIITIFAMLIGAVFVPAFIGYVGDHCSIGWGIILTGVLFLLSSVLLKGLKA